MSGEGPGSIPGLDCLFSSYNDWVSKTKRTWRVAGVALEGPPSVHLDTKHPGSTFSNWLHKVPKYSGFT